MRCRRCQGLMVWDRFIDLAQTDRLWAFVWRCVNCGEVLDAVILSHRRNASPLRKPAPNREQAVAIGSKGTQAKARFSARRIIRKRIPRRNTSRGHRTSIPLGCLAEAALDL